MTGEFIKSDSGSITPELSPDSYKVVVTRYVEDDRGPIHTTWTLFKTVGEEWVPCRRDEPNDQAVFDLAGQVRFLDMSEGEYGLSGARLDVAS
ncbi:MAG TPA: hypothetical protein VLG37_03780 [Candidatus Saccharimonadales bacterium]|nr:hypothetical protein [Candidatus Saccharimonadales bacterium]